MTKFENEMLDVLTWIGEFRPGNKTIWVAFDEESDLLGLRTKFLHPDRLFKKTYHISSEKDLFVIPY